MRGLRTNRELWLPLPTSLVVAAGLMFTASRVSTDPWHVVLVVVACLASAYTTYMVAIFAFVFVLGWMLEEYTKPRARRQWPFRLWPRSGYGRSSRSWACRGLRWPCSLATTPPSGTAKGYPCTPPSLPSSRSSGDAVDPPNSPSPWATRGPRQHAAARLTSPTCVVSSHPQRTGPEHQRGSWWPSGVRRPRQWVPFLDAAQRS